MSLCERRRLDCQCLKMALDKTSRNNTKKSETKSDHFVVYGRTKKTPGMVWKTQRERERERDIVKQSLEVHFWESDLPSEKKPFNHVTN